MHGLMTHKLAAALAREADESFECGGNEEHSAKHMRSQLEVRIRVLQIASIIWRLFFVSFLRMSLIFDVLKVDTA